ncbi:MAG: 4Fe-4S binding protein [archaeon YNP-LCB-024-027]|nr:4Fe-4S binding protein [Candidatus Culexarchaeum yellowstonense]
MGVTIEIDHDKCIGAGECVRVCPTSVYKLVNGKSVVENIDNCIQCCACVVACPTQAIKHSSCG